MAGSREARYPLRDSPHAIRSRSARAPDSRRRARPAEEIPRCRSARPHPLGGPVVHCPAGPGPGDGAVAWNHSDDVGAEAVRGHPRGGQRRARPASREPSHAIALTSWRRCRGWAVRRPEREGRWGPRTGFCESCARSASPTRSRPPTTSSWRGERRIVRYARGQPMRRLERKPGAQGRPRQFSAIHGPVERRLESGLNSPVTIRECVLRHDVPRGRRGG